ncbi:glycerol-3-phosphate dehydrogenase [Taklimakanibacter deserti]|uniref:glycerol-3-phosphate dehydrogenase n=1 Tax=Taklimakanibacter deserti TaxID=2267839 RepID=UPI000E646043
MTAESTTKIYDLFVIGGGINGAAIACDAAGRGLSVALAEMQDFAEGTSSRSSKLIHGGLRYLETYDFKLVRDALLEREILMRRTPHLVWPLRLVLPYVESQRPRWMIRLGLLFYDYLAHRKILRRSEAIDLHRHPAGAALKPAYRHAFAYSDCRGDDARLVIANLLGAERNGADILARHRFIGAERDGDLWRITLENMGRQFAVASRALVNAAGPWVVDVTGRMNVPVGRKLRLVRGSHVVVPRQWSGDHGYFLQTRDGRLMEAFPYEGDFTSIGTTDEPWDEAPEKVTISDEEIDYMLAEVNEFFRKPVTRADIVWSYSGVRPLFETGGGRDGDLSTLTRDYSFEIDHREGEAPVLTVFGGKLTTHRRLAEHAMQKLCALMPWPQASPSRSDILPGGDFGATGIDGYRKVLRARLPWLPEMQANRYVQLYGTRADELLKGAASLADLGPLFGADLYQREVDFLKETEWAVTVEDVIWRRSKLGLRLSPVEIGRLQSYLKETAISKSPS